MVLHFCKVSVLIVCRDGIVTRYYKTSLCHHYQETGYCAAGVQCRFAHGEEELLPLGDPKSLLCPIFKVRSVGWCKCVSTLLLQPTGTLQRRPLVCPAEAAVPSNQSINQSFRFPPAAASMCRRCVPSPVVQ